MRIEETTQIVAIYDFETDTLTGQTAQMITIDIYADSGKAFKRLSDNILLDSTHITVGSNDNINNYLEIDLV